MAKPDLLLRIVQSNEIALPVKKKLVSAPLVTSIVDQFDSYDVRERDYVKTITHRIYGKLTNRRAQIRRRAQRRPVRPAEPRHHAKRAHLLRRRSLVHA